MKIAKTLLLLSMILVLSSFVYADSNWLEYGNSHSTFNALTGTENTPVGIPIKIEDTNSGSSYQPLVMSFYNTGTIIEKQIVTIDNDFLRIFDSDLNLIDSMFIGSQLGSMAIDDLDGDGLRNDIFIRSNLGSNNNISIVNFNGTTLTKTMSITAGNSSDWSNTVNTICNKDFDGDNDVECMWWSDGMTWAYDINATAVGDSVVSCTDNDLFGGDVLSDPSDSFPMSISETFALSGNLAVTVYDLEDWSVFDVGTCTSIISETAITEIPRSMMFSTQHDLVYLEKIWKPFTNTCRQETSAYNAGASLEWSDTVNTCSSSGHTVQGGGLMYATSGFFDNSEDLVLSYMVVLRDGDYDLFFTGYDAQDGEDITFTTEQQGNYSNLGFNEMTGLFSFVDFSDRLLTSDFLLQISRNAESITFLDTWEDIIDWAVPIDINNDNAFEFIITDESADDLQIWKTNVTNEEPTFVGGIISNINNPVCVGTNVTFTNNYDDAELDPIQQNVYCEGTASSSTGWSGFSTAPSSVCTFSTTGSFQTEVFITDIGRPEEFTTSQSRTTTVSTTNCFDETDTGVFTDDDLGLDTGLGDPTSEGFDEFGVSEDLFSTGVDGYTSTNFDFEGSECSEAGNLLRGLCPYWHWAKVGSSKFVNTLFNSFFIVMGIVILIVFIAFLAIAFKRRRDR